ncbi:MAG: hypothetical protein ACI8RA_001130 [Chlamydiales bacterium]|jgi:hypothetical protein
MTTPGSISVLSASMTVENIPDITNECNYYGSYFHNSTLLKVIPIYTGLTKICAKPMPKFNSQEAKIQDSFC